MNLVKVWKSPQTLFLIEANWHETLRLQQVKIPLMLLIIDIILLGLIKSSIIGNSLKYADKVSYLREHEISVEQLFLRRK